MIVWNFVAKRRVIRIWIRCEFSIDEFELRSCRSTVENRNKWTDGRSRYQWNLIELVLYYIKCTSVQLIIYFYNADLRSKQLKLIFIFLYNQPLFKETSSTPISPLPPICLCARLYIYRASYTVRALFYKEKFNNRKRESSSENESECDEPNRCCRHDDYANKLNLTTASVLWR